MNKMYPDWQIGKASINCNYDSFSHFPVEMIYQQLQGKASIRPMTPSLFFEKAWRGWYQVGGCEKNQAAGHEQGWQGESREDRGDSERLQYGWGNGVRRCVNFLMNKFIICTCTPSRNKLFFRIKSLLGGNIRSEQHLITWSPETGDRVIFL